MEDERALKIIQQQQRISLEQQRLITMLMGADISPDIIGETADIRNNIGSDFPEPKLTQKVVTSEDFDVNAFKEWLYSEGVSGNTVDSYAFAAKQFFSKFGELNTDNLNKYAEFLKSNFKPKTVNLRYSGMDSLFKFLNYSGYKFKRLRIQTKSFCDNAINEEQYNQFIQYAEAHCTRAAIIAKVIANTGVRVSELVELRTANLDIGYQDIVSKANKQRRIYFPKSLVSDIRNKCGKIYICESRFGTKYSTRGVREMLVDYAKKAGIPVEVAHPHSFRHFFAKMFLKNNNDITLLGDLLGHSDITTTAIYTRKTSAEQQRELDKIINW